MVRFRSRTKVSLSRTRTTGSGLIGSGVSLSSLSGRISGMSGNIKPRIALRQGLTNTPRRRNRYSSSRIPTRAASNTTKSSTAASVDCVGEGRLVLYSKTYHRGDLLELTQSQPDLADQQFAERAVSAVVTGHCCWQLYSGPNYSQEQITVRPGSQYTSVTSLASLFRSVPSVRKIEC